MREVLLTDVALWSALLMVAALIIIRRWRSSHSWIPARGPRGEALEVAGQKVSPPRTATVTRPGEDTRKSGGAAPRPARPAPAAPPQARPQATQMADAKALPRRPGAAGRPARTRATSPSERIVSYYDQADQPIADYLAALGWTQQSTTPPVRPQAQIPETMRRAEDGAAGGARARPGHGRAGG